MKNNYKEFAIDLAYKAGSLIKKNFVPGIKKQWKENNTPVTETDFAVNKLVLDEVRKNYPAHSVLAEEESNMKDNAEYVWVCDPIDGTFPFSHGIPTFAFSLALVKDGDPILGVVYDPMQDRMFSAEKNKGAFLNGKKTSVPKTQKLAGSLVTVGVFKHSSYYMIKVIEKLNDIGAYTFNFGSIVYHGMLIAEGYSVGATFSSIGAHDVAALKIIIEEAGGKATDVFGNDQRYDKPVKGALFSNGALHEELLKVIKENVILR